MAALFFVICTVGIANCLAETCAVFNFHGKEEKIIEVEENTNLTLPFELDTDRCNKDDFQNFSIVVSMSGFYNEVCATYCNIRHVNGVCISLAENNCYCGEMPGRYTWTYTMSKNNALPQKWVWHTSNRQTEKKEMHFRILCPLSVLNGLPATVEVPFGESTDIPISIQSDARIKEHKLCQVQQNISMCDRVKLNLTGSPPDLTLNVRLDNLRKEDGGQWRLELTNECGNKLLYFNLVVVERTVFEFPTLSSSVIHLQENETLELIFKYNKVLYPNRELHLFQNYTIFVTKVYGGTNATICSFIHENAKCVGDTTPSFCSCSGEQGMYLFNKTVDRSDSRPVRWKWSVSDQKAVAKEFIFDVKYPSRIKEIKFERQDKEIHIADQNTTFDVFCFWENGNPHVTAQLLDRRGAELKGSIHFSGQVRYTFPRVSCQDAGLFRCQAPGASQNKTATLLVKCPPDVKVISTTVVEDQIFKVIFKVHSYTRDLKCVLWRPHLDTTPVQCRENTTSVTGTPPNLTLTVLLEHVRREDEGQWRLNLSNDAGTTYLHFIVTGLASDL